MIDKLEAVWLWKDGEAVADTSRNHLLALFSWVMI